MKNIFNKTTKVIWAIAAFFFAMAWIINRNTEASRRDNERWM